jgi:hypothetical protein
VGLNFPQQQCIILIALVNPQIKLLYSSMMLLPLYTVTQDALSEYKLYIKTGEPISGAEVDLFGTIAPFNGTNITEGGVVYGDISASLTDDRVSSPTYKSVTPFKRTNSDGYTNYICPLHQSFNVRITKQDMTMSSPVTISEWTSTIVIKTDFEKR